MNRRKIRRDVDAMWEWFYSQRRKDIGLELMERFRLSKPQADSVVNRVDRWKRQNFRPYPGAQERFFNTPTERLYTRLGGTGAGSKAYYPSILRHYLDAKEMIRMAQEGKNPDYSQHGSRSKMYPSSVDGEIERLRKQLNDMNGDDISDDTLGFVNRRLNHILHVHQTVQDDHMEAYMTIECDRQRPMLDKLKREMAEKQQTAEVVKATPQVINKLRCDAIIGYIQDLEDYERAYLFEEMDAIDLDSRPEMEEKWDAKGIGSDKEISDDNRDQGSEC
jgi:hypothetical protein